MKFLRIIDTLNDTMGKLFSFLLLPLMAIVTIEVVARYIFNSPTLWAWVVNIQIFGAILVMGGGYALLHKMHVSVDLVVQHLSPRARALVNLFSSTLFFLVVSVLLWQSSMAALHSLSIREKYTYSIWQPPIYPLKMLIPIAIFLLFLQGVASFLRDLVSFWRPGDGA